MRVEGARCASSTESFCCPFRTSSVFWVPARHHDGSAPARGGRRGPFGDDEDAELIEKPSATNVRDAIEVVCEDNGADPLIDYLDGLSWDGIERLDGWLTTYCAVTDTAYTRAVGRCWLIAAVARQYEPGCKVDTMLILEGPQGIGKSTALSILAVREGWFLDHLTKLSDKDSQHGLTGRWIVEMSELAALKKAKGEELKAFLSRQTDKFRPAYGRRVEQRPRRCVFAGTTNEAE